MGLGGEADDRAIDVDIPAPPGPARPPAHPENQPGLAMEKAFIACWQRLSALPALA